MPGPCEMDRPPGPGAFRERRSGTARRRRMRRRTQHWTERLADCMRNFLAFLFGNVGIVCLVVGYTVAGAFVFTAIEGKFNFQRAGEIAALRNLTASRLWELTYQVPGILACPPSSPFSPVSMAISFGFHLVSLHGGRINFPRSRSNLPSRGGEGPGVAAEFRVRRSMVHGLQENVFSEKDWKAKVRVVLEGYQEVVVAAARNGYQGADSVEGTKQWSFAGAFLYSLTVITTIGYGNTCPNTAWGKVVTIVYAIVGMPLFLLYLSNIGDIFARSFKWTYARCCLCRCRGRSKGSESEVVRRSGSRDSSGRDRRQSIRMQNYRPEGPSPERGKPGSIRENIGAEKEDDLQGDEDDGDGDDDDDCYSSVREDEDDDSHDDPQEVTVPLTLCLAIMVGYVCGGAMLFSKWEDWDFLDGSYFCFVSLSTIGFGDIVPGDKIYSGQGLELSFVFCSMYLMLGMALIAMCFNLMQEEVIAKMRTLGRIARYIVRCGR
ncbi:potassium channel subfamily K member 18 [Orussus abietinus]|uniref:potassium channel subfamily K member 18 n=1 Tax=Orussus abietinus TaxID=222816 RepID=UPI000C71609C|nr:potassium channel subfamily K member 18 [Orussus abietinus]